MLKFNQCFPLSSLSWKISVAEHGTYISNEESDLVGMNLQVYSMSLGNQKVRIFKSVNVYEDIPFQMSSNFLIFL